MNGYKIRYGEYGHDCWGASEWFGWYDYDDVIYTNFDEVKKIILDLTRKEPNKNFEIYKVQIN